MTKRDVVTIKRKDDGSYLVEKTGHIIQIGSPEDVHDALLRMVNEDGGPPDALHINLQGFNEQEAEALVYTCEVRVEAKKSAMVVEGVRLDPARDKLAVVAALAALQRRYDFSSKTVEISEPIREPDGQERVVIKIKAPAEEAGRSGVTVTSEVTVPAGSRFGLLLWVVDKIEALLDRLLWGGLRAGDLKLQIMREYKGLKETDPDFERVKLRVRVNADDVIIIQRGRPHGFAERHAT